MPDNNLRLIQWINKNQGKGDEMRKEVGNAFWNYQHTLAKWTRPDGPSQDKAYKALVAGVESFPCPSCSGHGLEYIEGNPFDPDVETFQEFVCRFHNFVNQHLGKPIYDCLDEPKVKCVPEGSHVLQDTTDASLKAVLNELPMCEV